MKAFKQKLAGFSRQMVKSQKNAHISRKQSTKSCNVCFTCYKAEISLKIAQKYSGKKTEISTKNQNNEISCKKLNYPQM